jgi:hypothetical protein
VFIDECPFNLHLCAWRGRALWGELAQLMALLKQQNLTLTTALS